MLHQFKQAIDMIEVGVRKKYTTHFEPILLQECHYRFYVANIHQPSLFTPFSKKNKGLGGKNTIYNFFDFNHAFSRLF